MKRPLLIGLVAVVTIAGIGWAVGSRDGRSGTSETEVAIDVAGGKSGAPTAGELLSRSYRDEGYGAVRPEESADGDFAASQPPSGGPEAQPVQGITFDRKIVRTASLDLRVEAVVRAFEDIGRIATGAGGFVSSSSLGTQRFGDETYQVGSITIRVPNTQYEQVMASIRGLASEVVTEQSDSSDVTEEYTDLESRLRNLQATEREYLSFLDKAQNLEDILIITDRLNTVRADIEQVQGRINLLENLSDLATVTVHLTPVAEQAPVAEEPEGAPNPLEAAEEAWERSLETLAVIASGVLTVVVYSWWIAPPALLGLLGLRALLRRRPAAPAEPSPIG